VVLPLLLLAVAGCAVLAGWALWFVVRDRAVILKQLFVAGGVEAVIVVQAVVAGVLQATRDHPVDGPLFWGYVVTAAIVLPIALTVAFLEWRLWQIWTAA
jgi:hypothetical protein